MPSEAGYRVADIAWHSGPRADEDAEQPALAIALDDGRCIQCIAIQFCAGEVHFFIRISVTPVPLEVKQPCWLQASVGL